MREYDWGRIQRQMETISNKVLTITQQGRRMLRGERPRNFESYLVQASIGYIAHHHYGITFGNIAQFLEINTYLVRARYHKVANQIIYYDGTEPRYLKVQEVIVKTLYALNDPNYVGVVTPLRRAAEETPERRKPLRKRDDSIGDTLGVKYKTEHGYVDRLGQIILRP